MPSTATAPAAPTVGAAAGRRAALPATPPQPAPPPIAPAAVAAVRLALARTQPALFDARAAMYALRDDYRPQPGRFAQLRAAVIRYREARAAYAAAAAAFHASPQGRQLQRLRQSR